MIANDSIENSCPDPVLISSGSAASMTNRIVAGWELASVIISFLTAEWIIQPSGSSVKMFGAIPLVLGLLTMLVSHYVRVESARDIGFRFDNFLEALRKLALPMLLSTSLILIVGWATGGFQSNKFQIWQWIIWLPVWGCIQQYALQGFINRRAQILSGKGVVSSLIVACIFALLHLPNPWLAVATFAGGFIWSVVYQDVPNLFALGLSHAFMVLMLVYALPTSILKSLRVGFRYFS